MNDPHCVSCKRDWNREFIDLNLTQTFRKGDLKKHRRKVLMDRERGRLPSMQIYVEARITYRNALDDLSRFKSRRYELKILLTELQSRKFHELNKEKIEELAILIRPIIKERSELKKKIQETSVILDTARATITGEPPKEVRQFIMKCPADSCRGFLSTAWKCGTCLKFYCADCHAEKAGHQDDSHVCNEDAKATAAMIRRETKPCPKCGVRISKIDGCDQMWCTSCQTTFSWNSGQILLNIVVHNPHYYEYLRRIHNGAIPREAGDVPCGGHPNAYTFTRFIWDILELTQREKIELLDIVRCLDDLYHVRIHQYPLRQAANVTQDLDIRYLMNEISEEDWGTGLERLESSAERKKEIGLILQTLLHVGSEKTTQLQNTAKQNRLAVARTVLAEMRSVRSYTNKSWLEKGIQMDSVVPQITAGWQWVMVRKADMKLTEEIVEVAEVVPAPIAPEPQRQSEAMTVIVEIEGDIVEMTQAQAQQILA